MGSLTSNSTAKRTYPRTKQRSKGDRLGWKPLGESVRRPLSELATLGGRVTGIYCVTSCPKLIP